jgi:acetyl esterase/lipase
MVSWNPNPMRRILSATFGTLAAVMGLLIALPTISYQNTIWVVQMLLGEFSWLSGIFGLFAVGLGAAGRQKSSWGITLGAFALGISAVPFAQLRRTAQMNEGEMRAALGEDYEHTIPPIMRGRLAPRRWALETSFGARRWQNHQCDIDPDIVYHATPQRTLMLDIYRPKTHPARGDRYPAIIVVHGGAWRFGDKGEVFIPHNRYLAGMGYVVFDVQYRLSDEAGWPAQIEDLRCAIAWVKRYAAAYHVDPDRIALLGRSAGGHLALLAAYDEPSHAGSPAPAGNRLVNGRVAAVIAIYAPTDLRMWLSMPESEVSRFLGGTVAQKPEAYHEASPLELARDGLPPTLLVQGYRDDLVAPAHTELLANKLAPTGTPAVTLRVPWARHGFDAFLSGIGSQIIQYDIDRFLAWSLYREALDE